MNLVFRVNYHTVPSQSLRVKFTIFETGDVARSLRVLPLEWLDHQHWQAVIDLDDRQPLRIEYGYQLVQENGVELDEWLVPRAVEFDPTRHDTLVLLDTWRSAGTVDYAWETKAFAHRLPERRQCQSLFSPPGANHSFQLRMAAVPEGHVPCVLGNVGELGNWQWNEAVPMQEIEPDFWQVDLYLPEDSHVEYKYGIYQVGTGETVELELWENRVLPVWESSLRQWTRVSDEGYRRNPETYLRGAGVAIPVFSLRSAEGLGVGEFADLKAFADWAKATGLRLIQILPINDTTSSHEWTDCYPYSAISVFALHPIYLRIRDLKLPMPESFTRELDAERARLNELDAVDHEAVMRVKLKLTREIFDAHRDAILESPDFQSFLGANRDWVVSYAVFCVKRDHFKTADFSQWSDWAVFDRPKVEALANPAHPEWPDTAYHIWLQCELDRQLASAVRHLHHHGIALKGDLAIGVNRESVDSWEAPHLFKMDAQAGAPPDAFAVKGQNWGFPTYNWEVMRGNNYAWWRSRFAKLSRYFDAYRIDHILGFFRIWQIPLDQTEGIMGYFDPALPIHVDEFGARGIAFDHERFCKPYLTADGMVGRFGEAAESCFQEFFHEGPAGRWVIKPEYSTQRRVSDHFDALSIGEVRSEGIRQALLDCVSEVLFFEIPGSDGKLFHPRCSMQSTSSYQELDPDARWRVEELYNDYFYRRQEDFWQARGYEKLPAMRNASSMLLCGEDLGMVPACVPGVLQELGILSLEIQRMPKVAGIDFFNSAAAPYMSVVSPSTHDMPTLREWWREDSLMTAKFAWQMFGRDFPAADMDGETAAEIIIQHLRSPGMWAIFPLQDLLAMDEDLRRPDPAAERINNPAVNPFYWRYRMHLELLELAAAKGFNDRIAEMIEDSGR